MTGPAAIAVLLGTACSAWAGPIPGETARLLVAGAMMQAGVGAPGMPPPLRPLPACDHVPRVAPFQGRWTAAELTCDTPVPWRRVLRTGAAAGTGAAPAVRPVRVPDNARPVLSAARPLRRGDLVSAADIVIRPVAGVSAAQALTDPVQAVGRRLRAAVGAGQPLLDRQLDPVLDVEPGQTVSVVLRSGAIELAAEAVALGGGRTGDLVPVQVFRDGRRIEAEVAGPRNLIVRPKIR